MSLASPGSYKDTGVPVPDGGIVGVVAQRERIVVDSPAPVDEGFVIPPVPTIDFSTISQRGTNIELKATSFSIPSVPVQRKTFIHFVNPKTDLTAAVSEIPLEVVGGLVNALEKVTSIKITAILTNFPTEERPRNIPVILISLPSDPEAKKLYESRSEGLAASIIGAYQIVYTVGRGEYYRYEVNFSYPLSIGEVS